MAVLLSEVSSWANPIFSDSPGPPPSTFNYAWDIAMIAAGGLPFAKDKLRPNMTVADRPEAEVQCLS
ncbi:hypothetical protein BSU04_28240 [Caballeronia sordidicola]|uniref:Uncharacterized protein n=1 Tax=Caballeronia sordidicola TaxID=196367 RepID=A0A226WWL0_CABSO|nr:hypothetical protein BSU04_28240 [Caballeronia sordidicola]